MIRFDWKTLRVSLLLFPLFVLVNCSLSGGQNHSFVSLDTEEIQYGESLIFMFDNITSDTVAVYTSGCGTNTQEFLPHFVIQQESEGKWTDTGSPVCIEIATKPIILAPGEKESIQIPVKIGLEDTKVPGHFRYVFDIRRYIENGTKTETELHLTHRVSPPVNIVTQ